MKDKLTARKPLSPKSDNAECQKEYAELLKGYGELAKLCVDGVDQLISEEERARGAVVSLAQYNARVAEYMGRRAKYNERYSGSIETIEDVKARLQNIWKQFGTAKDEEEKLRNRFYEKWGYEPPMSPMDDLMERDVEAWHKREEEFSRKFAEWNADYEVVLQASSKANKLLLEKFAEESKFEELEAEADAALKCAFQSGKNHSSAK